VFEGSNGGIEEEKYPLIKNRKKYIHKAVFAAWQKFSKLVGFKNTKYFFLFF
jgi:hypothetical protein